MTRRLFFKLWAGALCAKVLNALPIWLKQLTASALASLYYNRRALQILKKKFVFGEAYPCLPLQAGKTIQWLRYLPASNLTNRSEASKIVT